MSSCVFTAWFTVTGFHFSIWANLYMNIGHVDLTSAIEEIDCNAVIMCFSPWNLCIVWMTAPAHGGGEGHLCRDSGVLLMTLCRRRRLRGSCQSSRRVCGSFLWLGAGRECAIHFQTKARSSKFSAYLLDLADTSLLQVPIFKNDVHLVSMISLPPLSFLCYLNCYSPSSMLHTKPINFPLQKGTLSP